MLSSPEAEYIALSNASKTELWLRYVLQELEVQQRCTTVFQDNSGTIGWANGGGGKHFSRRKHIDIWYKFVLQLIEARHIWSKKGPTEEMRPSFLTKAFGPKEFKRELKRSKLSVNLLGIYQSKTDRIDRQRSINS